MGYRADIALRCGLMSATIGAAFLLWFIARLPLTAAAAGALSVAQFLLLVRRIDRWNRALVVFFDAVANQDFSQIPLFPRGGPFEMLKREYRRVTDALRKQRQEQERRSRYLQTIADDVDAALLVFDSRARIDFSNASFRAIFGFPPRGETAPCLAAARAMRNGSRRILRVGSGREALHLIVAVRDFMLAQEPYRLVTFQNVTRELQDSEMNAWQEMARVFNHEIMNSLTPISSLASTARGMLPALPQSTGAAGDLARALQTIERRSEGLQRFAESYRTFLRVPRPTLAPIFCSDLLSRTRLLLKGTLEEKRIDFRCQVPPRDIVLVADGGLVEQVLINLVMNSVDACAQRKKPAIHVTAYRDEQERPVIDVTDNGSGIPADLLDRVFVPFFSTKSEGGGIGLSLCRQIMRLHGGTITVSSAPDVRTVFSLRF